MLQKTRCGAAHGVPGQRAPEEQIVSVGWVSDVLKEANEIVVLTVNVANDLHRRVDLQEGWLPGADHLRIRDDAVQLFYCHVHLGARFFCAKHHVEGVSTSGGTRQDRRGIGGAAYCHAPLRAWQSTHRR